MRRYTLTEQQGKAIEAIEKCRTESLGYHILECKNCHHRLILYNSCRNRHCPKCQGSKQLQWVEKMKQRLLPCRYFHVVFTIPSILNEIIYGNQCVMYDILLRAASEAVLQVCRDSKHLGARTGCLTILHTWGQNLMFHPHVHILVPAGGLSEDGWEWVKAPKRFLVPVRVLSKIFRARFVKMMLNACETVIKNAKEQIFSIKDILYSQDWVVYSKKTMPGPGQVVTYLGRYTHRVAISNSRIISVNNGEVRFRYKDYRFSSLKWKIMKLSELEFLRRFLLHVLPCNFYKIRHYGIFSLSVCKKTINRCSYLLGLEQVEWTSILKRSGIVNTCPVCREGNLVFAGIVSRKL